MQSQLYSGSHYFPKSYRINSYLARNSTPFSITRQRSRSPGILRPNIIGNNSKLLSNSQTQQNPLNTEIIRKIVDDIGIYPSGFAQVLKNQDKNVKNFKFRITNEKEKVDQDISSFKIEINHTLQDLRLSIHAHLDRVYQAYLDKMAKFRGQLFQIHRLKQQLQMQFGATANFNQLQAKVKQDIQTATRHKSSDKDSLIEPITPPIHGSGIYNSNSVKNNISLEQQTLNKISSMEAGNKQYQKFYVLNYIAEIQKQRVGPLAQLQKELVVLSQYQNGFYRSKEFMHLLSEFRQLLSLETRKIYDKNYLYIRDIDSIVIKEKEQPPVNIKILDGLDLNPQANYSKIIPQVIPQGTFMPVQTVYRPIQTIPFIQGSISSSEQSLVLPACQSVNIAQEAVTIQLPNNLRNQTALCGVYINNQIALGLKEGVIQILSCDGHNITTLKQHKANICTLSVIRTKNQNYLASGSDVGCCKVIIWDPVNWQPRHVFNSHQAAVTSILDLKDDTHILSTGYDGKLNIYNLQQGKQVYSIPQTEGPMTSALINKTGSRIVGCGLDKALYVWSVARDQRLKVTSLTLERKIQNNATISSVVSSELVPQLVVIATKDSKIKLVNIEKGSSYKTLTLSSINGGCPYPLEICLIERNHKQHYPIVLVWAYKQPCIYKVDSDSTLTEVKNFGYNKIGGGCHLQYGYGVNPKSWYVPDTNKGVLLYSVNHRMAQGENCVGVYRFQQLR